MRAFIALFPEEPCRTGGPLPYSLPAANLPKPFWYQSRKKQLKWRWGCRHELKEPTFQNSSFNLSIKYSRALITLFCSIFHYSIDKMLYKFNSCLYQLTWGKIGFITCHFTQKSQNWLMTLSEDLVEIFYEERRAKKRGEAIGNHAIWSPHWGDRTLSPCKELGGVGQDFTWTWNGQ